MQRSADNRTDTNTNGINGLSSFREQNNNNSNNVGTYVMNTNQTSSSNQNVPMSYSSTNSKGYLNTRF